MQVDQKDERSGNGNHGNVTMDKQSDDNNSVVTIYRRAVQFEDDQEKQMNVDKFANKK